MRKLLVVIIAFAAVATIALMLSKRAPEQHPQPPRAITIAQAGDFYLYAPLYIAVDAGFFTSNGLDVTIVSTGGDDKTWSAVTSGSAEFGVADPTFVAVSAQRGQPGKVVASIVNGVPFWGITFKSTIRPFKSPSDLRGHTVATFGAPSTAFALQSKMFADASVPPKIRQGSFGTLLSMLKANQADIALELEPNVSTAIKDGARVIYSMSDIYGDFAITGLTATPQLIQQDSVLVRQVVCSLQRALDFIHLRRDSTIALLAKRFPDIPIDVAAAALNRVIDQRIIPVTVTIAEPAWDKAVAVRNAVGDLDGAAAFADFVDMRAAQIAATQCRIDQ